MCSIFHDIFAVDCGLCPSQVFWGTLKQSMILDNADSFSGSDKHVSLLVPDSCRPAVAICFLDCISLLEPAAGNTIRASVFFDFVLLFFLLVPAEQARDHQKFEAGETIICPKARNH